ncbi:protein Z-dependent protease inhibitor [Paroedura picta]|uniref:protein Z-dependent protease inhibitor n=1 Tax=Paroedura picta TaxID=143630 RepID=UPI004055F3E8
MKAGVFLLILELCVKMCSSDEEVGVSRQQEQQSLLPIYWPSNSTDKQYWHQNVSDPRVEVSTPAFSMQNFTERNTNFGFDLYRKISLTHDNNIFISPLSLSFTLAVFAQASGGETHDQIVNSLNLHLLDDQGNRLPAFFHQLQSNITKNEEFSLLHNTVSFVQKGLRIKDAFRNLSKKYFDMEFLTVDFHNSTLAKNAINQHIQRKTKGKIPSLFDTLDQQAKIILVDYIDFGGKWLHPFSTKFTELESFYVDNYHTVQVPMMFKTARVAYTLDKNLHCVVLKIPYRGRAHMLVVMPQEGDLHALEDFLSARLVESWLRNMRTRKIDIYFPKFKLDQKYYMHQLLQDLGIKDLFSNKANLSLLTDQTRIKVSQVLQRACIKVDEEGTEAAAGTGSEITPYSMPPVIRVNRPFIFMIYEETTNALLFVGRVANPMDL